MKSTEIYIGF